MAESKKVILTSEGLEKLEQELEYLTTQKRQEVAAKIKQALAFGDLSENSEYDEAKIEQAQVEERIKALDNMLKNVQIIDEEDIDTKKVGLGSKVKVLDMEFDEEMEYTIVGSTEADPSQNKISDESPVGKALLGQKKNKIVEVTVPAGVIQFKILSITK
ncbi:MAG: transcription elongation factor GreA [Ruminococcaceae bacterium]|nr:transcription elongation factor GreA [Oscillospiraceae bacterium]